ncbi:hypothetical protein [Calidifontibacter terrae]
MPQRAVGVIAIEAALNRHPSVVEVVGGEGPDLIAMVFAQAVPRENGAAASEGEGGGAEQFTQMRQRAARRFGVKPRPELATSK